MTSLDGRKWTVRRRWLPKVARTARRRVDGHLRRLRHVGRAGDVADVASVFDDLLPAIAILIVVVAALAFLVTGLPLLIDAVAILAFGVGGAVARVLFRRPWTVEAVSGDDRIERQVVGWRRAGEEVALLAHAVEHGQGGR